MFWHLSHNVSALQSNAWMLRQIALCFDILLPHRDPFRFCNPSQHMTGVT